VYIWHNTIDATGDTASTEDKTFEACRTAVTELKDLVTKVINRLHGTRIFVTADHGFLFQQQALSVQDTRFIKFAHWMRLQQAHFIDI
ncbi:PglZ domain-containing protein, partial [Escherichia sp. R-CC3]